MNEQSEYWLLTANDDLITADAMLAAKRLLWAGFVCQLITEKALKAIIANNGDIPPKTHSLARLSRLGGVYDKLSEQQIELLAKLETMHIEARYPEYKKAIEQSLTFDSCKQLITDTKGLFEWIKTQL